MTFSETDEKEIWNNKKIIEELHYNLITIIGEDGLRKYDEMAKFLLYRIPIWTESKTEDQQDSYTFKVDVKDIKEIVKEHIANISNKDSLRTIVKESVSLIFENLGPKEKEYFNKSVRHLLKVRFV